MVAQAVVAAIVVGVAVTVLSGLARTVGRGGRHTFGAAALDGGIAASLAAVLVATMAPLERFLEIDGRPEVQLAPLERLDGAPVEFAIINVVLLVPTVLLLAQRWRSAGVVRLTLVGASMSAAIELAQLFHPERGTNVDDLILNTVGAAAAAIVGVAIRWARGGIGRPTPPRTPLEAELETWGSGEERTYTDRS